MKNIHFTIRPYRDYSSKVNTEFIYLCLVADNSDVVAKESIRASAWRNNENKCQEYWKHSLLTKVKDMLLKASEAHDGYIYNREKRLVIDDATYDEWYRWYYFIDGEDAHEFIVHCGHSQHTTHWQSHYGVVAGWKFYDWLKDTNPTLEEATERLDDANTQLENNKARIEEINNLRKKMSADNPDIWICVK